MQRSALQIDFPRCSASTSIRGSPSRIMCLRGDAWASYEQKEKDLAKQKISIRRLPPSGYKLKDGDKPRNILEDIIWFKETEVAEMKKKMPLYEMKEKLPMDGQPARDFAGALRTRAAETGLPALIAEVKKASPSRGIIQPNFDPVRIAKAYEKGGATCLSILTDNKYFQGSFDNLTVIRDAGVKCPLLCKEFIIDPWQVFYARAKGADAVLLIAAVLTDEEIISLMKVVRQNGMAALIEVHNAIEMDRVLGIPGVELVGINNRNLETFKVDINNTVELLDQTRMTMIHALGIIVVGESGLFTPEDIATVKKAGVRAVLVGESLVKQNDPESAIAGLYGRSISRESISA